MDIPLLKYFLGRLASEDRPWLGIAAAILVFGALVAWCTPQYINAECALTLQEAEMFLDGAVPYCDFVDYRQPTILYLSILPAKLSRACGIAPALAMNLFILAVAALSSWELLFVLRRPRMTLPAPSRGFMLLVWVALFFIVDWRGNTGQQEHWFILLYTPYLFLRVLRFRGGHVPNWFAILLGVQAGIGIELKPIFLFLAINIELLMLFMTRRRHMLHSVEIYSALGLAFLYWLHWFLVPPAMREAFFGRWTPLANYGLSAYNVGIAEIVVGILQSPVSLIALGSAVVAILTCVSRRRHPLRYHAIALASLACIGLLVAFLQQKGASHHYLPMTAAGLLCLALLIIDGNQNWAADHKRNIALRPMHVWIGLATFIALIAIWTAVRWENRADAPEVAALRKIIEQNSQRGDRVLVVATSPGSAYPILLQTGRRPASRYLYSLPIALAYSQTTPKQGRPIYRDPEESPIEERQFLRELRDDVVRSRPQLIVIQDRAGGPGLHQAFNVSDYLSFVGWTRTFVGVYDPLPSPDGWKAFERRP